MAMKKKGYAKGGAMKKKGYAKGGAMKKPIAMKKGSKLRMVEKNGKKVPFFAADGVGKMQAGGAVRPKKRPASMVKPKPRPGSKNGITKETLVGSMTKADVEKAINRGKNPTKKPKPSAPMAPSKATRKAPSKSRGSTDKDMAVSKQAAQSKKAPVRKKGDRAGVTAKKMGGGMMKKKGYAAGGVVKKKTPKPAANYKEVGKYIPKGSQDDKRPAGKLFVPATKSQLEKMRADKRRAERKKSGQLDQAKKKARKTAVKAMGGGMMKKKGMAKGGAMKKKGYAKGGVIKKMGGGMMKKKGMAKGGAMKKQIGGKMKSKGRARGGVARGSGAARPQKFTRNG